MCCLVSVLVLVCPICWEFTKTQCIVLAVEESQRGDCEASEGKVAIYKAVHLHYTKYRNDGWLGLISKATLSQHYLRLCSFNVLHFPVEIG